ncbi:MAG: hypothetical protein R2809_07285 [Flavobacteriales bacterium]
MSLFSAKEGNEEESIQGIVGYVDESRMKIMFYRDELPDWVDEGKIGVILYSIPKHMMKCLRH